MLEDKDQKPTAVVLGNFDGLHLGHRALFAALEEVSEKLKCRRVLITFKPHPREVLGSQHERFMFLSTYKERQDAFQKLNLDAIHEIHFDLEFSMLAPEDFFKKVLLTHAPLKAVVVGYNFRFGHKQEGDASLLKKLCEAQSIECVVVGKKGIQGEVISSSQIRTHLINGDIKKANQMLGYHFFYEGSVVHGLGRGGKIGIPTANLKWDEKILLSNGVYITKFYVDSKSYLSVTNIGVRPTFQNEAQLSIETHLIHQNLNLYGKEVKLEFLCKLREEKKFENIDALITQIKKDIQTAIEYSEQ